MKFIKSALNILNSVLKSAVKTVKPVLKSAVKAVKPALKSAVKAVKPVLKSAVKAVKPMFRSVIDFLKYALCTVFSRRMGRRSTALILTAAIGLSMFTMLFDLVSTKVEAVSYTGQTAYSSISEFQENEFTRIQSEIFGSKVTYNSNETTNEPKSAADIVGSDDAKEYKDAVTDNNDYFTWTDTSSLPAYSSASATEQETTVYYLRYTGDTSNVNLTADTSQKIKTTEEGSTTPTEVSCTTYYVYTGDEFRWALSSDKTKGTKTKPTRVVLMNDIDLNGKEKNWTPIINGAEKYLYIEGNGHTIYNFYSGGEGEIGLFTLSPKHFVVKNLAFKSTMLLQTKSTTSGSGGDTFGLLAGRGGGDCYLYNVHSNIAYVQTEGGNGGGGLIGRNQGGNGNGGGDIFIENCSTSKYIMYGKDHIGGITSYYGLPGYTGTSTFKYSQDMPDDPMYYVFGEKNSNSYPIMIKNTYSVDCTIFSTGADSGAFISCGDSIWAKNCFTNNTIYAADNTGGFIGRTDNRRAVFPIKDDADNNTISCYFENCYSTGIVEGKSCMGGFIGVDMGCHTDQTKIQEKSNISAFRCNVYKNCYSTAMVGMDYAGKYCGGFIGFDDNNLGKTNTKATITTGYETGDATTSTGIGSWYINCYAAGEVGNILTITDKASAGTAESTFFTTYYRNTLGTNVTLDYYPTGGFAGAMCIEYSGTKCNLYSSYTTTSTSATGGCGNFFNCYYDMQTSGMKGMAVGLKAYAVSNGGGGTKTSSNFNSSDTSTWFNLSGVTGVYTEKSTVKNDGNGVLGLTDFASSSDSSTATGSMLDGDTKNTWSYTNEYYPQLSVFMAGDTTLESLTDATEDDITDKDKASEFYIKDSGSNMNDAGYSKPVLSIGGDGSTNTCAAQLGAIIMAYRYSQASTATVLLDHWDYIMDTTTGQTYDTEEAWVGSVDNRLTQFYINEGSSDTDKADVYAVAKYYTIDETNKTLTEVQLASQADIIKIIGISEYTSANKYKTNNVVYAVYNTKEKTYRSPSNDDTTADAYDNFSGAVITDVSEVLADKIGGNIDASDIIAEWRITYEDRDASTLEFKIKEGANSSQAYNYGENGFNGQTELKVKIPYDECDVTIRFREGDVLASSASAKSIGFYVKADYEYDTTKNSYGNVLDTFEEADASSGIYVRGGFPDATWNDAKYEMVAQGNDVYTYTFAAGTLYKGETYSFKIADDSWGSINYGPSGEYNSSINMTFTVKGEKDGTTNADSITITFTNDNYHMTSVSGDISDSYVGDKPIDFDGYSLIASNARITGYKWLQSGYLLAAAQAGELKDEDGDGTYTAKFTVTKGKTNVPYDDGNNGEYKDVTSEDQDTFNSTFFETTLAYKVIEDGVDEGANKYFVLSPTSTKNVESFTLTFDYTPGTATTAAKTDVSVDFKYSDGTTESSKSNSGCLSNKPNCKSWYVLGDEGLTKYDWKEQTGEMKTSGSDGNVYEITYYNITAGTYAFKVVGDGLWATGVDYGNSDGGNFSLKLSADATSVTIKFNKSTGVVSVKVNPEENYDRIKYVVTGTENLMGASWDKSTAEMTLDDTDGKYHYTITKVAPYKNYAFKVIEKNNDQGEPNITFYIDYTSNVDIEVIYDADKGTTSYVVYKTGSTEELASSDEKKEIIKDTQIKFYSVLGDQGLTGYNWGSDSTTKAAAATAGKMEECNTETEGNYYSVGDKCYRKEYYSIPVSASDITTYSFKVAAEGDWDTGVSYGVGGLNGDNETITLSAKGLSTTNTVVDIIIYFNKTRADDTTGTYKDDDGIYVVVNPSSYNAEVDANMLAWVLVGDTDLTKSSTKTPGETDVYDTVRDITAAFSFTSGRGSVERGVTWALDSTLNSSNEFYAAVNYSLDYTVEDYTTTADITQKVVDLLVNAEKEDETSYAGYEKILGSGYKSKVVAEGLDYIADYTVSNFAPGKQWLTIQTNGYGFSEDYRRWKFSTVGYNEYQEALESYNDVKEIYISVLKGYQYNPSGDSKTYVNVDETNIDEYAEYLYENYQKTNGDSDLKAIYSSLLTYGDLYTEKQTLNNLETYYNALVNAITAMSNAKDDTTVKEAIEENYNNLSKYIGSYLSLVETSQLTGTDDEEEAAKAEQAIQTISNTCESLEKIYASDTDLVPDKFEVSEYKIENPTLSDQLYVGSRSIRLIPTASVEAGVDEQVNVVQIDADGKDEDTAENFVKLESDSAATSTTAADNESKIVVTNEKDGTSATNNTYEKYNFALTAGYLVTDKIGLGIYNNYNNQGTSKEVTNGGNGIQLYDESEIRNYDDTDARKSGKYFAMSSTFTQSASYNDDTDGDGVADANELSVETMVEQDLIGPTLWGGKYLDDEGNETDDETDTKANLAKTIVKVYKQSTDGSYSKVIMDTSSTEYSNNIKKWTAQEAFTSTDTGTYRVQISWAMSDGRYITDSKYVTVATIDAGLDKAIVKQDSSGITTLVNSTCVSSGKNEITYDISYTSDRVDTSIKYTLLDILPYDNDARYLRNTSGDSYEETDVAAGSSFSLKLKSIKIIKTGGAYINGMYYTTQDTVRTYTGSGKNEYKKAASKIEVNDAGKITNNTDDWTDVDSTETSGYHGGKTYTVDKDGVTGIAITGTNLSAGETLEIQFTVECELKVSDYLANSAFYKIVTAESTESTAEVSKCDYSKPATVATVGRNVSGYVWYDADSDGVVDTGEYALGGVRVALYDTENGEFYEKEAGSTYYVTTGTDGKYTFEDIPASTYYQVRFYAPDNDGVITAYDSDGNAAKDSNGEITYKFSDLVNSTRLNETECSAFIGSRSLAYRAVEGKTTYYYINTFTTNPTPTNDQVFADKTANGDNSEVKNYLFKKSYQNLGLVESYTVSAEIIKVGNDGTTPLKDVTFTLEYENNGAWYAVYKKDKNDAYYYSNVTIDDIESDTTGAYNNITYKFTTDKKGKISFEGLNAYKYRITEIETLKYYALLSEPVEFELPYSTTLTPEDAAKKGIVLDYDDNVITSVTNDGETTTYYKKVGITVQNNIQSQFTLPVTGGDTIMWLLCVGFGILAVAVPLIVYSRRKKKPTRRF